MTKADRWLLPDGVEEVLPPQAHKLETLRRGILDLYSGWGYELVITPLIEYLDSLLVGSSHDLDLHTFKLTDQLSGRMMGVRADITPQVARVDAHHLHREGPVRLCYADSVLHTRPRGLQTSRVPIRIGAELFGHAGSGCDVELICLMAEMLQQVRIGEVHLVLGHVAIFRNLVRTAGLSEEDENALFDAMQRKAFAEIDGLLARQEIEDQAREMLRGLSRLSGGPDVLDKAKEVLSPAPEAVHRELRDLTDIADAVRRRRPGISLGFDLCELRGYQYHTGIVFAAYTPGYGRAIAKGGRYDDIGRVFGRARPASGFDADLKVLARLSELDCRPRPGIFAPAEPDAELEKLVARLRADGERVLVSLDGEQPTPEGLREMHCDRLIEKTEQGWQVVSLTQ